MNVKLRTVGTLNGGSIKLPLSVKQILLLLSALGFFVTAIDVTIAHFQNHLIPVYEWIPVIFSPIAAVVTVLYMARGNNRVIRLGYQSVMVFGILMGLAGFLFHLVGNIRPDSTSPAGWFLGGVPVFAPLAFSGMSLLGLALIEPGVKKLMYLSGLAFLVTGLTAYLDHAPTHFESFYTLIPVVSGIFSFVLLWVLSYHVGEDGKLPSNNGALTVLLYSSMGMMILVGLAGFYLHVVSDLEGTVAFPWARMFYRAPSMAPLGFAQISLIAVLSTFTDGQNLRAK